VPTPLRENLRSRKEFRDAAPKARQMAAKILSPRIDGDRFAHGANDVALLAC
jgi:hypothetical protein